MAKLYPPCKDQFGKRIRGAITYRTRKFGSKQLVWTGKVRPDCYFLPARY